MNEMGKMKNERENQKKDNNKKYKKEIFSASEMLP
jgi:hypothetical protein